MPISATDRLFSGWGGRAAIAYRCHVWHDTAIGCLCSFVGGIHPCLISLPERLFKQSIPETDKQDTLLGHNLYPLKINEPRKVSYTVKAEAKIYFTK